MSQSSGATYYTCNGCDHATFRLSEAIAHYAHFGGSHTFDYNGGLIIRTREWQTLVCNLTHRHTNHLRGGCSNG